MIQRTGIFPILFLMAMAISVAGAQAQTAGLRGRVISDSGPVMFANIILENSGQGAETDSAGYFILKGLPAGTFHLKATAVGYQPVRRIVSLKEEETIDCDFELQALPSELGEIVISGTMKAVSRLQSPVPVEVYTSEFLRANPGPSVFDALQNINGVRPQLNCNICNTGDIHINGLEGPYTMVLIDGMPVVSGLSTVYGLCGIPQSLIDRIEIVKGPASTLYGSEAVAGLINIITRSPEKAPLLSADVFATNWGELNADLSAKFDLQRKAQTLLGLNYFNYSNPIDNNGDHFTDATLQNRFSVFNKWHFSRSGDRLFSLAGRYVYEDRWGGEMNWEKKYRGGNEVYGESIYTSRWEMFGMYQLPTSEKIMLGFSANGHHQNSAYGDLPFWAKQKVAFSQLTWNKSGNRHDLLTGLTYRYTYYDDNTPATSSGIGFNQPSHTHLPGAFIQDEITMNEDSRFLAGIRYDYNSVHGSIVTPRINYKWSDPARRHVLRIGFGNGYRVANVFTEDHAALTGAREVVFRNALKPEKSWNGNINFIKKMATENTSVVLDLTAFYTYFTNKIIADYETDPNKILYDNLGGYAVSKGISLNTDIVFPFGLKILAGATTMDVYNVDAGEKTRQLFAERFTATWTIGYEFLNKKWSIDYTGNLYSPMRLPLLSETDPRSEYSPWWSIQNIQLTKTIGKKAALYGGVKNLLNWTPGKSAPFLIARSFDPFDRSVEWDDNGKALVTPGNPYGLSFDPSYVYAPNQGIRFFLGFRYSLSD